MGSEGGGLRVQGIPAAHGAAGIRPWQGWAGLWVAGSPGPLVAGAGGSCSACFPSPPWGSSQLMAFPDGPWGQCASQGVGQASLDRPQLRLAAQHGPAAQPLSLSFPLGHEDDWPGAWRLVGGQRRCEGSPPGPEH